MNTKKVTCQYIQSKWQRNAVGVSEMNRTSADFIAMTSSTIQKQTRARQKFNKYIQICSDNFAKLVTKTGNAREKYKR